MICRITLHRELANEYELQRNLIESPTVWISTEDNTNSWHFLGAGLNSLTSHVSHSLSHASRLIKQLSETRSKQDSASISKRRHLLQTPSCCSWFNQLAHISPPYTSSATPRVSRTMSSPRYTRLHRRWMFETCSNLWVDKRYCWKVLCTAALKFSQAIWPPSNIKLNM